MATTTAVAGPAPGPATSDAVATSEQSHAVDLAEDSAETAAAVAAAVVDSVVEGTVAAVISNNQLPSTIASTTVTGSEGALNTTTPPPAVGPSSTSCEPSNKLQSQPQTSATNGTQPTPTNTTSVPVTSNGSAAAQLPAQTYNNLEKSKRKERLEQNRISARESRKRKKSMIEELQRTVITLTAENKELNGRNSSLRSNLMDIGRKYPNSAQIQAIVNGMPSASPHHQQPQSPVPNTSPMKITSPAMAANYLQLSQQQLVAAAGSAAAVPNVGVPVVPIVGNHPNVSPAMVVPYMYIPQATHAPSGLVQISPPAVSQQPVAIATTNGGPSTAPAVRAGLTNSIPVAAPPPQTAMPVAAPQQQQHIAIAPQPLATTPSASQATLLPSPQPQAQQQPVPAEPPVPQPSVAPQVPPPASSLPVATTTETVQAPSVMDPVPNPIPPASEEVVNV